MKKLFYLLMLGLILIVAQTSFAGDRSYVMVCRGGGEYMELLIWLDSPGGPWPVVKIVAKAGTVGASQKPPNPGECTWVDRGMRKGEFDSYRQVHLRFSKKLVGDPRDMIGSVEIIWRKGYLKEEVSYSRRKSFKKSKMPYLIKAFKTGQLFYLHVRRISNNGRYEVTHIGP